MTTLSQLTSFDTLNPHIKFQTQFRIGLLSHVLFPKINYVVLDEQKLIDNGILVSGIIDFTIRDTTPIIDACFQDLQSQIIYIVQCKYFLDDADHSLYEYGMERMLNLILQYSQYVFKIILAVNDVKNVVAKLYKHQQEHYMKYFYTIIGNDVVSQIQFPQSITEKDIHIKPHLILRDYQEKFYTSYKNLTSYPICINALPRFGKNVIMLRDIINYRVGMIMTTYPNQCIQQYINDKETFMEFEEYKIITAQNISDIIPDATCKYILMFSKQYFREDDYVTKINMLQKFNIDIMFCDEFHYSGVTELTQKVIQLINVQRLIYVSGTPQTLIERLNIPEQNVVEFNLIHMMQQREIFSTLQNFPLPIFKLMTSIIEPWKMSDINLMYHLEKILLCEITPHKKPNITLIFIDKPISQQQALCDVLNGDIKLSSSYYFSYSNSNEVFDPLQWTQNEFIKAQQCGKNLVMILNDQLKVGTTLPDCWSIIVINQNLNELLIQQCFRCLSWQEGKTHGQIFLYSKNQLEYIINFLSKQYQFMTHNIHVSKLQLCKEHIKEFLLNAKFLDIKFEDVNVNLENFIEQQQRPQELKLIISDKEYCDAKKQIDKIYSDDNIHVSPQVSPQLQNAIKQIKKTIDDEVQSCLSEIIEVNKEDKHKMLNTMIQRIINLLSIFTYGMKPNEGCVEVDDVLLTQYQVMGGDVSKIYDTCFNNIINVENQDYDAVKLFIICDGHYKTVIYNSLDTLFKHKCVPKQNEDVYAKHRKLTIYLLRFYNVFNKTQLIKNIRSRMTYINSINQRYEFITNIIQPTPKEKTENAEILTPLWLAQEMVQTFDIQVGFSNIKTICEPCVGKGVFLIPLTQVLTEKYGYTYQWVVEHMLMFNDINEINVELVKFLLDPLKQYKLQYMIGDALQYNYTGIDFVITNPPYNKDSGNLKNGGQRIYDKFIINFTQVKFSMLLIPSKIFWQFSMSKLKQYIQNNIQYIKLLQNQNIFDGIRCYETCYYILDSQKQFNSCQLNDKIIQLETYNFLKEGKQYESILKRYTYVNQEYFIDIKLQSKGQILCQDYQQGKLLCYVSSQLSKNYIQYIDIGNCKNYDFIQKYKIIVFRLSGKEHQSCYNFTLCYPGQVYNWSYCGLIIQSLYEAEYLINYFKTDYCQQFIQLRKTSRTEEAFFELIPDTQIPLLDINYLKQLCTQNNIQMFDNDAPEQLYERISFKFGLRDLWKDKGFGILK